MRNSFLFTVVTLFCSLGLAKTRVAVSTFDDKTGSSRCNVTSWFGTKLGHGFKEQLISELSRSNKFSIQERENLKKMYHEEHELINSDSSSQPQKNKFKAAHYSIAGAVTSFELCESGAKGGLDVGKLVGFKNANLKVGGGKQDAKVVVDIRVVDVETGEVVKSFTAEGEASSTNIALKGDLKGADFNTDGFKNTPIGEATRNAIKEATEKIVAALPDRKDPEPRVTAKSHSAPKARTPSKAHAAGAARNSGKPLAKTTSSSSYYCPHKNYGHLREACKPLSNSKSGERVNVIYLTDGRKSVIKKSEIHRLEKGNPNIKLGESYYISCNQVEHISSIPCRKKSVILCPVTDEIDGGAIVNCKGHDLQASKADIYKEYPYAPTRTAASQKRK